MRVPGPSAHAVAANTSAATALVNVTEFGSTGGAAKSAAQARPGGQAARFFVAPGLDGEVGSPVAIDSCAPSGGG